MLGQYSLTVLYAGLAAGLMLLRFSKWTSLTLGGIALLSWTLSTLLIPKMKMFMLKAKIFGLDINKKGSLGGEKEIPQCVGFAGAISFCMIAALVSSIFIYLNFSIRLDIHLAAFVTILGTILLGFADDMLDLPWRYKLLFPFFIVLPLVSTYDGSNSIQILFPFSQVIGERVELGWLFLLYITLLGIYCTNTINIYAGINGLEVGQSIIAASSMLIYNAVRSCSETNLSKFHYSAYILLTFLAAIIPLMKENAYPSKIFIGDTFCYFSGIVLAISALMSESAIAIHWFLIPQLINFLYSIPQLFGWVPCPRHRLTVYNKEKDVLLPIRENMNVLNLSLRILGPTNEGVLCEKLLWFQILASSVPILYELFWWI